MTDPTIPTYEPPRPMVGWNMPASWRIRDARRRKTKEIWGKDFKFCLHDIRSWNYKGSKLLCLRCGVDCT